ncbi:MAG: methylenetetrahydrofolate reductase C-terminal domain-containing protein [Acidobacteriia bacterium]|nr:methylenetetrahydrofolate reductase C-terminal domain-containing protein [Terriglobia bacterium]
MKALRHWSVRHAGGLRRVYDVFRKYAPSLAVVVRLVGRERSEKLFAPLERAAKGLLFDCRMCGQCVLSSTGMACPENCGKEMRNGPCGGVRPDGGCEVKPKMRCVWLEAGEGRKRIAGQAPAEALLLPPVDQRHRGRSTWLQIAAREDVLPVLEQRPALRALERPKHDFERACESGRFLVTAEIAPPDSSDCTELLQRASRFRGLVDALNITDGAGAHCHLSSVAAAAVLTANGHTAVCQMACRDRNRLALQGDLLGAAALGVRNFLCLTGDDIRNGDHPGAKAVFDLDAVSLLGIARGLRDAGRFASGRKLEAAPNLFLGAAANPFVPPYAERVTNLEQKINAGAQFIQTQFCFDLELLENFMRAVRARGLHERCRILVGVGALRSAKGLRWMAQHVPGVHVPEKVIQRVAHARDQALEGKKILLETIAALRGIEGVAGVHLMGHKNEDLLADAIVESGLRTRVDLDKSEGGVERHCCSAMPGSTA